MSTTAARLAPALVVALGAAAATAHGLFEVAVASRVPAGIAWLYPVITDGLALVAYSATSRLVGPAARYAWACVVLAAALSGLAQASYLAAATVQAPTGLRFGAGAWPAIACALVAHLVHLMHAADRAPAEPAVRLPVSAARVVPITAVAAFLPERPPLLPSPPVREESQETAAIAVEETVEVDPPTSPAEVAAPAITGHKMNDARAWYLHERGHGRNPSATAVNAAIGSEGYVKNRHLEAWDDEAGMDAPAERLHVAR